jgi:hypothetical protein
LDVYGVGPNAPTALKALHPRFDTSTPPGIFRRHSSRRASESGRRGIENRPAQPLGLRRAEIFFDLIVIATRRGSARVGRPSEKGFRKTYFIAARWLIDADWTVSKLVVAIGRASASPSHGRLSMICKKPLHRSHFSRIVHYCDDGSVDGASTALIQSR